MSEEQFWNSTISELGRLAASYHRSRKAELQEKSSLDYTLADMIGRSVSRIYDSSNTLPNIEEVYPSVFDKEAVEQKRKERQAEELAIKFNQFVNAFNQK